MSTQPTSFRVIRDFNSKQNREMLSLSIKKEGDTFSAEKLTGENSLGSLSISKLVPMLKQSADEGQSVLFISATNSGTITPTKPQTTLTIKERVGEALAAIPAAERPEVRLIIESNKNSAGIKGQSSKFGTESVTVQPIILSTEKIRTQFNGINREFATLNTNTIPVITNAGVIDDHPDRSFDSKHPLGIILNNFDKLFKIAA